MSTIKDFKELTNIIENESVISIEATDLLLELDALPSTTTQAALNDWLVALGNRIKQENCIVINAINTDSNVTLEEYNNWLHNNFTTYSYDMYIKTLEEN